MNRNKNQSGSMSRTSHDPKRRSGRRLMLSSVAFVCGTYVMHSEALDPKPNNVAPNPTINPSKRSREHLNSLLNDPNVRGGQVTRNSILPIYIHNFLNSEDDQSKDFVSVQLDMDLSSQNNDLVRREMGKNSAERNRSRRRRAVTADPPPLPDNYAWAEYDTAPTTTPATPSPQERQYEPEYESDDSAMQESSSDEEEASNFLNVKIIPDDAVDSESDFPMLPQDNIDTQYTTSHLDNTTYTDNSSFGKSRPVVYRYFGRNRARSNADSVPFILLGPCTDHWKETGKTLASRGFSVMVCEEVNEGDDANNSDNSNKRSKLETKDDEGVSSPGREGQGLVLAIMDALRWKRAVIVGCDINAKTSIEAAMELAPDRVAGLVLCGDLSEAEDFVRSQPQTEPMIELSESPFYLDYFLQDQIQCPSTIIWDGDVSSLRKRKSYYVENFPDIKEQRTTIVGGGLSPHRRHPDQFAWVLTRFAEDSVSKLLRSGADDHRSRRISLRLPPLPTPINQTLGVLSEIFSPGTALVSGRLVASAIVYISAISVTAYQYRNLQCGLSGFKSQCHQISMLQKKGVQFIMKILASDLYRKHTVLRNFSSRLGLTRNKKSQAGDNSQESDNNDESLDNLDLPKEGELPLPEEGMRGFFHLLGIDYATS